MAGQYISESGLAYIFSKIKSAFVQKDGNKVLSDQNYTIEEKTKLANLETNVQADWNATEGAAVVLNRPDVATSTPSMNGVGSAGSGNTYSRGDHVHPSDTTRVPISRKINGKELSEDISITSSDVNAISNDAKGVALGVATLDSSGRVPSEQLPSYVDDVIEGYLHDGKFYEDAEFTIEIAAERGKIYIDLTDNRGYRWSGSIYVAIVDERMTAITNEEIEKIWNET